jgi:hypothetical protein
MAGDNIVAEQVPMPTNFRIAMLALSFGGAAFLICGVAVFLTIAALRDLAPTPSSQALSSPPATTVIYYTPAAIEPVRTAERRE